MNNARSLLTSLAQILLVCLSIAGCTPGAGRQVQARLNLSGSVESGDVISALNPQDSDGFKRAQPGDVLAFPDDYGPHPDYQIEWWYYTGNLETDEGRHFGFQLTFFRRALVPPEERISRSSVWSTDQVFLAHFALSDVAGEKFYAFERYSRGAAGLSGASADPYHVWLYDWEVEQIAPDRYTLDASQENVKIRLELNDVKGPILHGERGYSQKGPQPGNASYYFSQTRLESSGEIQIGEQSYPVSGLSWMDHEFSTNALTVNQVGWDWFSLQLDDGSELMVFQIRRADGSIDPFSSGTLIEADGSVHSLAQTGFSIQPLETWRSPHSGGVYPSAWKITLPEFDLSLDLKPYLDDQELRLTLTYWEGAVQVSGARAGAALRGDGYVELTGYTQPDGQSP